MSLVSAVDSPPSNASSRTDQSVALLAAHRRELLRDLQAWIGLCPQSTQLQPGEASSQLVQHAGRTFRIGYATPEIIRQDLAAHPQQYVHLFPGPASLLLLLAQPGAAELIVDRRWTPVLAVPMQNAMQTARWLGELPPGQWPWKLADAMEGSPLLETARVLEVLLGDLLLRMRAQLLKWPNYRDRATPGQILRENQRKLRVLAVAYQGSAYQQSCARDIAQAVRDIGHDGEAFIASVHPHTQTDILHAICGFDPDVLVLNGKSRREFPDLPPGLTVVTWDQDYLVSNDQRYPGVAGPRDRLFVMVDDWRENAALAGIPATRVEHLNLGTNHRIYFPDPEPGEVEEPSCDILFVGNIHPFETYRKIINFDRFAPPIQQLLLHARDRLADWVEAAGADQPYILPDCDAFLRQSGETLDLALNTSHHAWVDLVLYFRYRIAHFVLRERYIAALAEFRLGLYGNGWEHFPSVAHGRRPVLENGEPLRREVTRAAINLHLHTWTVHHPRLYDTAASGGFLVVGRVPERYPLSKVFEVGSELDDFGSIPELKQKVKKYLAEPALRSQLAARAAQRARRDHTMAQRMGQMVHALGREVPESAG